MKLIDKDALVAEIERRKHKLLDNIICESDKEWVVRTAHQLNRIILFLDTLEVKEVELTWMDMECIIKNYQDIMAEKSRVFVRVEDYQELLKRFKAQKGEIGDK